MANQKVLIIGAGLGGLVLAQSLRRQGINFEIFERDSAADSRYQGWALSLHWGLAPLLEALPKDMTPDIECVAVNSALGTGSGFSMYDGYTGECMKKIGEAEGERMIRANRAKLRNWLSQKINIVWDKKFSRYEESTIDGNKIVTAFFEDGTTAQGTILVGADGVHSRVREQLFAPDPPTLNTLPICMNVGIVDLDRALLDAHLNLGLTQWCAFGDHFRLLFTLVDVNSDKQSARGAWVLSWIEEQDGHRTGDVDLASDKGGNQTQETGEISLPLLQEKIKELHPRFQSFVKDGELVKITLRDLVPPELPRGHVTLLGDAIHPMSTFRGEGGNNAMLDGCKLGDLLGEAIRSVTLDVSDHLKRYESEMRERGTKSVLGSRQAGQRMHAATQDWRRELIGKVYS